MVVQKGSLVTEDPDEATRLITAAWKRLSDFNIGNAYPMMTLGEIVHLYLEAPTSDKRELLALLRNFAAVGDLNYIEVRDLLTEMKKLATEHLAIGKQRRRSNPAT